jgi:uncharacterized protein involved in cysteine biosynthesis
MFSGRNWHTWSQWLQTLAVIMTLIAIALAAEHRITVVEERTDAVDAEIVELRRLHQDLTQQHEAMREMQEIVIANQQKVVAVLERTMRR